MGFEGIGAAVRRKEDFRFLSGRGNYTDDINRPGQLYAVLKRSDRPHATLGGIDTKAAAQAPGVVAVFTGADLAADNVGGLPCGWQIHNKDGSPMAEPPHPVLAIGKVRHVGDPVAVVIATTKQAAKDAAELIAVDYQDLPAVASLGDAVKPGAALVHDEAAGNVCYDWHIGDKAATEAAFAGADRVVKLDLVNNRLIPNAMEPRAAVGDFDTSSGDYTLYTTSQNPHVIRLLMGAFVLHIPENKLRVVAPDVGGGFGSKIYHYAEEAIVTWAAGKLRKPVKWTAERNESFVSDAHGRDHVSTAEMAIDKDGHFLGLRVHTLANMGGYLSTFAPCVPTYLYATLLAGVYKTPVIYCEVKAIFTNTVAVDAYRGAGRPRGDVPAGAAGGRGGARHRHRPGGAAPAQLHSLGCVPVSDAGGAAIRQRQLHRDAGCGAEGRRPCRLRGAPHGGGGEGQAARHRRIDLSGSLRHRAVGGGGLARRAGRAV